MKSLNAIAFNTSQSQARLPINYECTKAFSFNVFDVFCYAHWERRAWPARRHRSSLCREKHWAIRSYNGLHRGPFFIIPKNEFFVVEGRTLQVRGQTDRVASGENVFAVATVAVRARCETIFHFANGYRYARTTELHPARNSVPPEIVPPNAVRIETRISKNSSPTSRSITSPVATR